MRTRGRNAWVVGGLILLPVVAFGQWRSPDRSPPPPRSQQTRWQVEAQFLKAQLELANPQSYNDPRALSVPIDAFLFVAHIEKWAAQGVPCPAGVPFECCWGWFVSWTAPPQVHFTLRKGPRMEVIGVRHESMHAIAWYLGRPDWRTIEHPGSPGPPIGLSAVPEPDRGEDPP